MKKKMWEERWSHREDDETQGKNGTKVTNFDKKQHPVFVYICLSYRKKRGKFSLKRCFGKKRGSCGCVSSFQAVVAWWGFVEASLTNAEFRIPSSFKW